MGTQVLSAQECLISVNFQRGRKPYTANRSTNPKRHTSNNGYPKSHAQRRLQKPTATDIHRSDLIAKHHNKKQHFSAKRIETHVSSSDSYAGSGFVLSPSPRCLPLPSFFNKKQGSVSCEDVATKDLRRMLRLE